MPALRMPAPPTAVDSARTPPSATFRVGVTGLLRFLAGSLVAMTALGCKVYDPSLVPRDAGTPSECDSKAPPPRPSEPDDGVDVGERVWALRDVVFEQSGEAWRTIGYDLDGRCSQPPDWDIECRPPLMTAAPEADGEGGIDNSFGHNLFPLVEVTVPGLEETSRMYQMRGVGTILIILRGWNGEDDDSHVEVVAGITVFATPGAPGGTEPPDVVQTPDGPQTTDGTPLPEPVWDGNDWFWLRSDNFFEGNVNRPFIVDDNAYVTNRTLVLRLPERTDFIFPGEEVGLLVRLTGAVGTVRISEDESQLEDITVAGRWPVLDLLATAEAIGVCAGSTEHGILENQLQRTADVRDRAGSGGSGASCNAVSLGLEFETGIAARFAGLAEGDPVPDTCAEAGADAGT